MDNVFALPLLREEWKKRVRQQIRKQLIFDPIEYRDYFDQIEDVISKTRSEVVSGKYVVRPPARYLVEKSKGLCRQMTLVHPKDLLVLERLSRAVYFELKEKAPSKSAYFEPDDGSFVKGFQQSDFSYGSFASWKRFQKVVFGFAKENKYVVVTDVANFYDFINFQHLRNIIASLADIRESILDLLIYVLNRLTWTPDFMPLTQVGMPQIETTATRVLANAMLFEVDRICEVEAGSNYARFMDDMDVGVSTIAFAKRIIRDIDLTLQSRQLRLNSSKTRILSQEEAYHHYRIKENGELVRIEKLIGKKTHHPLLGAILSIRYENWLDRTPLGGPGEKSRFISGSGPKIHKFTLSLMEKLGLPISETDLLWLIKNDPGMRSTALRYLAKSKKNNTNLVRISAMVKSGIFVDDASFVDICGFLLHAKFKSTAKCTSLVRDFCEIAAVHSDIDLHAAILAASKFLSLQEIMDLLSKNKDRISADFWLSRAAGGLVPRFIGSPEFPHYHDIVMDIDREDCYNVFNYMRNIASATSFPFSLKSYLKARNDSFPQNVYFPKVLCLLAASKNASIGVIFPDMHKIHPALKSDPYFFSMGF